MVYWVIVRCIISTHPRAYHEPIECFWITAAGLVPSPIYPCPTMDLLLQTPISLNNTIGCLMRYWKRPSGR